MQPGLIEVPSSVPGYKVRKFDASAISRSVDEALAAIPEGHKMVVVGSADLAQKEAKLVYAHKIGDAWSVMAYTGINWAEDKDYSAGFAFRWSPPD